MSSPAALVRPGENLFESALRFCEAIAAVIAGALMLLTMVLTTADALLRYTFNAPLTFNFYFTENYLMVGMLTLPLAWGFRNGGYIRIMAVAQLLSPTGRHLLLRAGLLVSCAYVAALAWLAFGYFLDTYERGDVQMGVIDWPVSWSWVSIPIGLGLLAVRLLAMAFGPAQHLQVSRGTETEEAGI